MDEGTLDKLMIAIELDPSKFEEGRKKLSHAFKATRDEAGETGKDIERSGKSANAFFDELTSRALKLGTVLLGGAGLGEFIVKSVQSGAALGYMSKNLGVTAKDLFTLQTAVRTVGGDAEQVAPALLGLSQAMANIQLHGRGSEELIGAFQFLGITDFIDHATGKVKNVAQLLPEIQKGLTNVAEKFGAPIAYNLGKTLGLTDDLINLFLSPQAQEYIDRAKKVSDVNDQQTKSFQKLIGEWGVFKGALQGVGYEVANQSIQVADDIAKGWEIAATQLEKFIDEHKLLKSVVDAIKTDPLYKKIVKEESPYAESDAGAAIGGFIGGAVGSFVPVVGTAVGAAAGVAIGGAIGAADAERRKSKAASDAGLPPPSENALPSPGQQINPRSATDLNALFNIIGKIEGGRVDSRTPTNNPNDPYAYGKNQITLGTALSNDKNATVEKLLDPDYNDALARKIQQKYAAKYNGDLDVISVAYNAGEGAADRYVKSGKDAAAAGLKPETVAYIDKERRDVAGVTNTNTTTNTTHIGSIPITAPNATNAAEIAAAMRQELSEYQLLSQGNAGPQ